MNEIKTTPVFENRRAQTGSDPSGPPLKLGRSGKTEGQARPPQAPATRRDLVELNKHLVAMFRTLNDGLSDQAAQKAAADRDALGARIDEMTEALNGMEGLLRIEIAPQFRMMLNEAFAEYMPQRRRRASVVRAVLLALGGVAIGVLLSDQITEGLQQAAAWVSAWI